MLDLLIMEVCRSMKYYYCLYTPFDHLAVIIINHVSGPCALHIFVPCTVHCVSQTWGCLHFKQYLYRSHLSISPWPSCWLHLVAAAPQIRHQQVVTWTSMINACAKCQPRRGVAAQKVFQQMLQSGVQPNKAGQVAGPRYHGKKSWFLSSS